MVHVARIHIYFLVTSLRLRGSSRFVTFRENGGMEARRCRYHEPLHCAIDRAESADADIEMTWRKAFPAICDYGTVAKENRL